MADRWRWKEPRVRRFLNLLKTDADNDAEIDTQTDAGITVITIRKYDRYQRVSLPNDARTDAATDAAAGAEATHDRRKEEDIKDIKGSEAKASGAIAPAYTDARHQLWAEGVPILISLGEKEARSRQMVGLWLKQTSDDAARVLGAIQRARDHRVHGPVAWITRALNSGGDNGKRITTVEPIPVPDPRRPARPISLPHWAKERLGTLKTAEQPDPSGRYRTVPVLPVALMLTPQHRAAIEQHVAAVTALLEQTPERNDRFGQRTLVVVSKLLVTLAGRESGELAGAAKGEAYMAALDDVPCWATEEAARLWYRGECGAQHNYTWPPAPAILRGVARKPECALRWSSTQLRQLLIAEEERVFSAEHCATMRVRLSGIMPGLAKPPRTGRSA
jgi:hypothetical protein